jgi:hypothetical protein
MARLSFPIHDRDKLKGSILFQPYQQIPPSIDTSKAEVQNSTDVANDAGGNIKKLTTILSTSKITAGQEVPLGESCVLYLPPSIAVQDGVNLENIDLGVFGAGLSNALSAGTAPAEALMRSGQNSITSLTDAFKGNLTTDAARAAASRLASGFGGATAGAVSSALATTPNPNTRVIFKSVNLREFSFDFKLMPKSIEEAQEIEDIINFFRRNLYPKTINLQGSNPPIPIAYKFPNKFDISIKYGERNLSKNIKFERMYMRTFSANYNPTQQTFYNGGYFQEVQMTVNFVESRTLTYDDVAAGNERITGSGVY